jgi:streptogramin lyase
MVRIKSRMDGVRANPARLLAALLLATAMLLTTGAGAHAAPIVVHPIPTADSGPTSLVAGPGGNLYFAESNVFKVGEVSPAAPGTINELPLPVPAVSAGDGFDGPEYLASSGNQIWAITDDFESLYAMGADGSLSPKLRWDGSDATGITADDAGGVWLMDKNATVGGLPAALQRVDSLPPTYPLQAFNTDDINQSFTPLATSPDGHTAWYAEDTPGQVDLVSINDAGAEVKLPVPIYDQTYQITSLAFSSNGTLWFTEHAPLDLTFPVGGAIGELPAGSSTPKLVDTVPDTQNFAPASLTPGPGATMFFTYASGIGMIGSRGNVTLGDTAPYTPSSVVDAPDGNLWFVDTRANSVGEVAPASLFGGAPAGPPLPTGPGPVKLAPRALLSFPKQRLSAVRTHRRLAATCALAGPGTCRVTASVTARTARHLHLKVARKASTVMLARASKTLKKKGKATLTLRLSTTLARALRHTRTLTLSVTATSSAAGATSAHVSRTLTLKR